MKISRKSIFTDEIRVRDIDVTEEQMELWINGILIQNAMPNLSEDEREFIISGITPEEWDSIIGIEE